VEIDYTNWKGVRRIRTVRPIEMWWGMTRYHLAPQFFVKAIDLETNDRCDFAMQDIHSWKQL
jgi:hypothetical protein